RAEERKEISSHPAPLGRPEVAVALCACLIAWALNLLALVTDLQAFKAVANPALISWLALCLVCSMGLGLVVHARRSGIQVPLYFRAMLGGWRPACRCSGALACGSSADQGQRQVREPGSKSQLGHAQPDGAGHVFRGAPASELRFQWVNPSPR